ncbi:MAG: transcriptional repressor [Candidatus Pelethousia sp.]|nr:transcriptional repressor [Candidatus Pelethousia sp.]
MKQQRHTRQRQLVLEAARARCDHPSADQLYLDVRALDDRISRGTVYRNLRLLVQSGELLKVKVSHVDRFDSRLDFHAHLLCTKCGSVCNAPLPYDGLLDADMAVSAGYAIARHHLIFEGICPACQKKARQDR